MVPELLPPQRRGRHGGPLRELLPRASGAKLCADFQSAGAELEGGRGTAVGCPGQGDRRQHARRALFRRRGGGNRPGAGTTEIVTGSGEKIEIGNLPEGSIAIIGGADGQTAIRIAENAGAQVSTGTQAGKVAELPGEDEETVNLSRKLLASGDFTQASALAFLVFILLYFPCIATIAAIGAEAGWKWAAAAVAYNTVLAWVVAWAVYRLFMWL